MIIARKKPKKQQKDDKLKSDRSEGSKDDLRDSTPSNKAGNAKTGGINRGGTNTPNRSINDGGTAGSTSAGRRAGGNSAARGKKGSKEKKQSDGTSRADKSKHDKDINQKDDSDEIDLSTIEIDPDEPTYCLCDQVRSSITFTSFHEMLKQVNCQRLVKSRQFIVLAFNLKGFLW